MRPSSWRKSHRTSWRVFIRGLWKLRGKIAAGKAQTIQRREKVLGPKPLIALHRPRPKKLKEGPLPELVSLTACCPVHSETRPHNVLLPHHRNRLLLRVPVESRGRVLREVYWKIMKIRPSQDGR
ncbi:hypothetical protein VUR80DRAFT_2459 [Thermomyces stellatus]